MSFLSALKGFGAWVAREWAKIISETPKIEKIADTVISYAAPALQLILGALDPPAAAVVGPIIAEIQKDLHVASGLIYDFGANPSAANILATVTKDLQGLLDAGHITNPDLVKKVTLIVNTVGSLATSLLQSLETAPAA